MTYKISWQEYAYSLSVKEFLYKIIKVEPFCNVCADKGTVRTDSHRFLMSFVVEHKKNYRSIFFLCLS